MKKNVVNAVTLRKQNRAAIIRLLARQSMSRADLARSLGMTRAAAGDHIDLLLEEKLAVELGAGETGRGHKPVLLGINPDYGCFAGIYLSRSVCRLGLVDMKGEILAEEELDEALEWEPDRVLATASVRIMHLLKKCGIAFEKLLGTGFSVPGPVDAKRGVVMTPPGFTHWHGVTVKEKLGSMMGTPVYLDNNAASQTLAELRFGHGKLYGSFMMLLVDSGVGGGIVLDGRRVTGEAGFGAELGHASIMADGRLCACGNHGCLERYAAIPELLRNCFAPSESIVSWRQVVDGAEQGDVRCIEAIEREAHYLATAIVSFVNALEPSAIILGGDLIYKPELLIGSLLSILNARLMMRGVLEVDVLPSALRPDHYILSAAVLAIDKFYEGEEE